MNSTSIHPGEIQKDIFFFKENDPCPQPFQLNSSALEPCNNLGAYDYFTGSEIGFVYSCVFLAFVPILAILAAYFVVKLQNRKRRRLKVKQEALRLVHFSFYTESANLSMWFFGLLRHFRLFSIFASLFFFSLAYFFWPFLSFWPFLAFFTIFGVILTLYCSFLFLPVEMPRTKRRSTRCWLVNGYTRIISD